MTYLGAVHLAQAPHFPNLNNPKQFEQSVKIIGHGGASVTTHHFIIVLTLTEFLSLTLMDQGLNDNRRRC